MRYIPKILGLILCAAAGNAAAVLNLELTKGVQGTLPLAIVPFAGQPDSEQSPDNVRTVVNTDLQNSGRFNLMDKGQMQQKPSSADNVDFAYWQKQNMNYVVVGKVEAAGGDKYRVQFQLLNAYANKGGDNPKSSAPGWKSAVLLSDSFTVSANQLRGLSHHISDEIYENLTGDKGIFSTHIAYVVAQQSTSGSQYALEVADMDGYNPKVLLKSAQPIMSPTWSPDGRGLAYVSFESGDPVIYVQDVATGSRQTVSSFEGLNSAPAWSPDSRRLAVVLTKSGAPKIFVMNLASKQLNQVTQGESLDTEPVWSADGNSIYFTSNRGGAPQIYRVDVGSGNVQRVTYTGNYNASASLSADGKVLAVLNGGANQFNIAVQDLAAGRYSVLTQGGNDQSPSMAPNGKMVIYATQAGGRGVLGIVSTDGKVKLTLPSREGDVREPAWGPFISSN